jgi:hypothetical protein
MVELLGGRAAVRTILDWRRGRCPPAYWAIDQLQEALKKACRARNKINRGTRKGKKRSVKRTWPTTNSVVQRLQFCRQQQINFVCPSID